jgi:hypothetical protein
MARQQKTERQRAEEAVAVAHRRRDRLHTQATDLRAQLKTIEAELEEAERILAYRRAHPALPSTSTGTTTTTKETTRP